MKKIDIEILDKVFKAFVSSLRTEYKNFSTVFNNFSQIPIEIVYVYNDKKYIGKIEYICIIDDYVRNGIQITILNNIFFKEDLKKDIEDSNMSDIETITNFAKECLSPHFDIKNTIENLFSRNKVLEESSNLQQFCFNAHNSKEILRIRFGHGSELSKFDDFWFDNEDL